MNVGRSQLHRYQQSSLITPHFCIWDAFHVLSWSNTLSLFCLASLLCLLHLDVYQAQCFFFVQFPPITRHQTSAMQCSGGERVSHASSVIKDVFSWTLLAPPAFVTLRVCSLYIWHIQSVPICFMWSFITTLVVHAFHLFQSLAAQCSSPLVHFHFPMTTTLTADRSLQRSSYNTAFQYCQGCKTEIIEETSRDELLISSKSCNVQVL